MELEEHGHELADVAPVSRVVGLDEEQAAGDQGAVDPREERGRDETAMHFRGVVERLRVVAMDFRRGPGREQATHERLAVHDGEADVGQAALVGPARGVAKDERQDIDADVVVVGPPDGAADQEPAIAAAKVDDQGGGSAKEGGEVKGAWRRETFEGSLSPVSWVKNLACEGDTELALDLPPIFHFFVPVHSSII